MDLEPQFLEDLFVEGFPVDILGGGGVGGLIVMQVDEGRELMLEDFCHEDAIGEIAVEVASGPAESDGVDPLQDFLELLFIDGRGFHDGSYEFIILLIPYIIILL